MKFISIFVEIIQEDEFSNQTTGSDNLKKDAAQHEIYFLAAIGT